MRNNFKLYDDFLFYTEKERIAKLLARYELYKKIINVPGDIVECGILHGTGLFFWSKLTEIFNSLSIRKIIGFDTFDGYASINDDEKDMTKKFINELETTRNYDEIKKEIINQKLNKRIEIIKGDATQTIPEYVKKHPGLRIAILNLDFDIFNPTLIALEELYPKIVRGGIIILDEFGKSEWSESNAIDEYFKGKIELNFLPWSQSPTAYIKKK